MKFKKIRVTIVSRKFSKKYFSIEKLFKEIIKMTPDDINITQLKLPHSGVGFTSVILNILVATFRVKGICHVSGDVHYALILRRKKRNLLTIHDLITIHRLSGLKRFIFKLFWYRIPIWRAHHVTTISEATKKELIKHIGVDSSKITVIPNCISEEFTSTSKKFNVSNPRILCIGTGPNKNLENLIAAVALLNCNLRIIGDINPTQQDILNYHKISFSSATRLTEEQIVEEYRQTDIVSFVSLYEGFGLPILEAQASGRALITSNLHPMNDVAGKDACLVDPYDIVSIYEGLQKIITNVEYRKILIRAGLKNSENFSSAAVSELYAEIYRKMSE